MYEPQDTIDPEYRIVPASYLRPFDLDVRAKFLSQVGELKLSQAPLDRLPDLDARNKKFLSQVGELKLSQAVTIKISVGMLMTVYSSPEEDWWKEFRKNHDYTLYGIILASSSDIEVASFVQSAYTELDKISGEECCLIFFRDLNKVKNLAPFQFSEHAERVYYLAHEAGIDIKRLPCILFFDQFIHEPEHSVTISLGGKSQQEIVLLIRKVFGIIRRNKNSAPLTKLKRFQRTQVLTETMTLLLRAILRISSDTTVEAAKKLVDEHLP